MSNRFGLNVSFEVSAFYENTVPCDRRHKIKLGDSAEFLNVEGECGPDVLVRASTAIGSPTLCQTGSVQLPAPNFTIIPFIEDGVLTCAFSPET